LSFLMLPLCAARNIFTWWGLLWRAASAYDVRRSIITKGEERRTQKRDPCILFLFGLWLGEKKWSFFCRNDRIRVVVICFGFRSRSNWAGGKNGYGRTSDEWGGRHD
jgi:hypothetical protein